MLHDFYPCVLEYADYILLNVHFHPQRRKLIASRVKSKYSPTQTENITEVTQTNDVLYFDNTGLEAISEHQNRVALCINAHPRSLRKARIQVQLMIKTGFSTRAIRAYLHRFLLWWQMTSHLAISRTH